MRRSLSFLVLVALVLGLGAGPKAAAQPLELTVEQAAELALQHNLSYRLATLDWESAKANLERAQIVGDADMLREAEKEWAQAEKTYAEKTKELKDQVRSAYQELLQSETTVENALRAKERAENQLAMDENKFKAGLLSSLDIERSRNSLFDAEHRHQRAVIDLETKRMRFNELLGLPLDTEVVLTERLLLAFVPFTWDLETCFELALALDASVAEARERLARAQEAVLAAQSPFTPRVELEQALVSEEKAKIQLQQAEQALYFRIRGDYYALLDQAHALELAARNIELERKALQAEQSKYQAGVISNADIVAKQERLAQLEQEYSASLLQYSLARVKLLQAMGQQEESGEQHAD
ncbi:TolC family protein [Candidatus Darwinibacter acetoxidans]|nr:TolC family protein [Limnochordia bacterium]HOQ73882.1 TolC family protein [Limnochordia bacterium]HPU64877.1 TolC family protein [Limnochordia bacterium]